MSFNLDPSKQAVEVYFSRKLTPPNASIISYNTAIAVCDFQKHLGLILDKKLAFHHHLNEKFLKAHKVLVCKQALQISTKGFAFNHL